MDWGGGGSETVDTGLLGVETWTDRSAYDSRSMELICVSDHDPRLVLVRMSAARYGRFAAAMDHGDRTGEYPDWGARAD